jgi:hypothetical protein
MGMKGRDILKRKLGDNFKIFIKFLNIWGFKRINFFAGHKKYNVFL